MDKNHEKPFTIVVGVDYSEVSALALIHAVQAARSHEGSHLHVFHSFRLVQQPDPSIGAPWVPAGDERAESEAAEELRRFVEKSLADFNESLPEGDRLLVGRLTLHLRFFEPAEALAQLASDVEADLVVVGTHGRRGVARLFLGSVAESVLRLAPCPVLVVRAVGVPPDGSPKIEPPCPQCVEARRATDGREFWCAQHQGRHDRPHTYQVAGDHSGLQSGLLIPLFH